jgi:hypothetical protein
MYGETYGKTDKLMDSSTGERIEREREVDRKRGRVDR